jgi:glycolate oxidase iron-sulfur subunit
VPDDAGGPWHDARVDETPAPDVLGTQLPEGIRFVGSSEGDPRWTGRDHPATADLNACVACGLCLPHCPTYRLTGDETASPRGRIAAMKAIDDGLAPVDDRFGEVMDLCLVCRACEDVCPSDVPFGRMMESARVQVEPRRSLWTRLVRKVGLDVVLPRPALTRLAAIAQPAVTPFLVRRVRELTPRPNGRWGRLPALTEPPEGIEVRGTVGMLAGCVQDRWFRDVNRATIGVLARNGWRVRVPPDQRCCGALQAHNGHLETARRLALSNAAAFEGVEHVVVNAAGCGAHLQDEGDLVPGVRIPAIDLLAFLDAQGVDEEGLSPIPGVEQVAYHDACHALRVQRLHAEPRRVLGRIPGLRILEIPGGDRCCGAAGLYNVTEPEMADRLMREKARAVFATGATVVASANPGCSIQLAAGIRAIGGAIEVVHPVTLLDRSYAARRP